MHVQPLIIIAFISLLANPAYNIDSAHVNYNMTLSTTGQQYSITGTISIDISVSQAGVAVVDVDMGTIPAEWTNDISTTELATFILSTADIAAMETSIDGETVTLLDGGKETNLASRYYGASLITGSMAHFGDSMSLKWNKATGIILSMHAEMEEDGVNIVIDVDYTSSDVDIYSDQSAAEKGWNQAMLFLATPLGIIIIAALVVIIIVLCIKLKVPKKIRRAVKR